MKLGRLNISWKILEFIYIESPNQVFDLSLFYILNKIFGKYSREILLVLMLLFISLPINTFSPGV